MKLTKTVTLTIHAQPRKPGPLSSDERKQLTDFFVAIMDLQPKEDTKRGETYDTYK